MAEEIKEIKKETPSLSRDEFLSKLIKIGAGTLAATIVGNGMLGTASKVFAKGKTETPVKRKYHYGMVIDTRRCVGCRACVLACKAENKTAPGVSYTVVFEEILENRPSDKPVFMTKPCFHCEQPPCTDVCPVSATYKREQDGIVVVDYDRCIGCRYCMTACPYSARWFDFGENYPAVEEKTLWAEVPSPEYNQFRKREREQSPIGNVRKCTFCLHLQDEKGQYNKVEGRWPACAKTCTGHAIHFGDFNDPNSEVSILLRERQYIRLKEELGTSPNVYYLL
jgi:Fe-S-cluster-containing dehydrogenase component